MLALACQPAAAAGIYKVVTYQSTISSDANGSLHLKAALNYNSQLTKAPIAVVMHGYSPATGNFTDVQANAQRLRDAGFFVISVAMRGRDGSDGVRDSGGLEIYDIYDAVEYVKSDPNYASRVDPNNVHITGYSGGGGNVMAAVTKFPDYFRLGSAFFGMSDYGYDTTSGWYFNGASSAHQAQMRTDIGDPTLGNPAIRDRYAARASNLASRNNPNTEIRLFVNYNEPTCPPVNDTTYRDYAVAHQSFPGEFSNITVHIGGYGQYVDFNHNGINESNELQSWPHGFPTADQQYAAQAWYLSRLLSGSIPQPVLNPSDDLYVAGYVKTKPFSLWLGDGQNAAGELQYSLSSISKRFELAILTSDLSAKGALKVSTSDMSGHVAARLNGQTISDFDPGGMYSYNTLGHNEVLELLKVLPGDATCDQTLDCLDLGVLSANWGLTTGGWTHGDFNADGVVNLCDLGALASNWGRSVSPSPVPEPGTLILLGLAGIALLKHRRA